MLRDKIIEILVKVDDFCEEFDLEIKKHQLNSGNYKVRDRKAALSDREIITILIAFSQWLIYQPEVLLPGAYLRIL
ncbi:MAG: family transposase [Mucilaginibacter sp.]|nr:family transposase [Mucilaginibacter sp.]